MQQATDAPPPVNLYSQDHFIDDSSRLQHSDFIRHGSPIHQQHTMMAQTTMTTSNINGNMNQTYARRVTYPFVPSIDTSSSLLMNGLTSPENSGSSPLMGSPFPQGGLVGGISQVPAGVQGMVRSSPLIGYMDAMTLQQQAHMPSHHHSHHPHQHHPHHPSQMSSPSSSPYPQPLAVNPHQYTPPQHQAQHQGTMAGTWITDAESGQNGGAKTYSFVPLSGVNTKKRPRRRFDEIERLYVCSWSDCEKAYGTLNHLNAHVNMQKHGSKRHPSEFKELRKAWRRQKKAEEEAAKQVAVYHHQQQVQQQQHQQHQQHQHQHQQTQNPNQFQLCDQILTGMHAHPMAMHPMSHHQPHQLPHPHAHPNQHSQHHPQGQLHHQHPMGF